MEDFSKLITGILCDNHGCLDFEQLNELAQSNFGFKVEDLRSILFDDGKIAIREGKQSVHGEGQLRPGSLVVAKTSLGLCQKKVCSSCESLHLCRYFVCGSCTFGEKCKNPHSLASPHNATLLRKYGLQDLTEKQLFQLLLQNDPHLLPVICTHYNKGNGPFGSCKHTTSCTKLHVCQHFLLGDCNFGASCKRAHCIDAQGMKLFKGFSPENVQNFSKIYRNKLIIMGQQPSAVVVPVDPRMKAGVQNPAPLPLNANPASPTKTKPISDAERNEICLYNIRTQCSFKDKCARVHWHLPYKWEVLDIISLTWKDMPDMEDVEKAFCDPSCDMSCMNQQLSTLGVIQSLFWSRRQYVDFKTMTYGGSPVRRLSTASSVLHPPHFILTTQWVWYWKEDNGSWLEYGQLQTADRLSQHVYSRRRARTKAWKVQGLWMNSSIEVMLFRRVLLNPTSRQQFQHFVSLKGDFLENDVRFWVEVQKYKDLCHSHCDEATIHQKISTIISCFINSSMPPTLQIDIPADQAQRILEKRHQLGPYIFREAQVSVFSELLRFWPEFQEFSSMVQNEQLLPLLQKKRLKQKNREWRQRRKEDEDERRAQQEQERELCGREEYEGDNEDEKEQEETSETLLRTQSRGPLNPPQSLLWSYSKYMAGLKREEMLLRRQSQVGTSFSTASDFSTDRSFRSASSRRGSSRTDSKQNRSDSRNHQSLWHEARLECKN